IDGASGRQRRWQFDSEGAAPSHLARYRDRSPERVNELRDDREAEPDAAGRSCGRRSDLMERLEHMRQIFSSDPGPRVRDGYDDTTRGDAGIGFDRDPAGLRELDRIVEGVSEHLGQFYSIRRQARASNPDSPMELAPGLEG